MQYYMNVVMPQTEGCVWSTLPASGYCIWVLHLGTLEGEDCRNHICLVWKMVRKCGFNNSLTECLSKKREGDVLQRQQ